VTRYDGKTFRTLTGRDGPVDYAVTSMLQDRHGNLWFGGKGKATRYDGKRSETFTTRDGLPQDFIVSIVEDRDGFLWFGSHSSGISRFDGKRFATFTTADGLLNDQVEDMVEDMDGYLWMATQGGGFSRYEGTHFASFTPSDGLPTQFVFSILQDSTGVMWFGTRLGLVRYDGEELVTFTAKDGLADDGAHNIAEDRDGNLWIKDWTSSQVTRYDGEAFSTLAIVDNPGGGQTGKHGDRTGKHVVDRKGQVWFPANPVGVVRYDGQRWRTFTTEDGLISNRVQTLAEDRNGHMWFGTEEGEGVSRYDGETFISFTREQGLGFDRVVSIGEDSQGNLWFGSNYGSVSRYDGETFTTFTFEDGLKPGIVRSILNDRRGHLWFGIWGGGVVRHDGLVFQDLHHRDGLIADSVHDVYQDRDGDFWIATDSGVTRYRPSTRPPVVRLTEVVADRSYGSVQELALPSSQHLVQFIFQGRSFSTPPGRMVYVYRLQGYEEEWQFTRQTEVRYTDLPTGDYVFQVKAVDRDLNYSDPVELLLTIHPPYGRIALVGGLGLALFGLVVVAGYGLSKRRAQRRAEKALMQELEEELQTAHDLQMGLMPAESPRIEGLDIAGRCLPANHVGGDFFQYFSQNGGLSLCMADVTGHAMEAAIPVVMFNGILESQMELGGTLEELFARLNRSLYRTRIDNRTFICFTMGELDISTRMLRLSNGGCPYPLHYHATTGQVTELQVDAYPLGVRADTVYSTIEVQLESGDDIIFCSDGIAEAANVQEAIFGFERTAETIRQVCAEDLSAEVLIDRLIGTVKDFTGDAPQGDDMTVVVLKVEG